MKKIIFLLFISHVFYSCSSFFSCESFGDYDLGGDFSFWEIEQGGEVVFCTGRDEANGCCISGLSILPSKENDSVTKTMFSDKWIIAEGENKSGLKSIGSLIKSSIKTGSMMMAGNFMMKSKCMFMDHSIKRCLS